MTRNVLMMVGSPRGKGSASLALGNYLLEGLSKAGCTVSTVTLYAALATEERERDFLRQVDQADLLVLATPLYVDSLPARVIEALELIAGYRGAQTQPRPLQFAALINCGFPEARHNESALRICRQFARETGLEWAGGLGFGSGGVVTGQPLGREKGLLRNWTRALRLSSAALAEGRSIPGEAEELIARPLMPKRLYTFFGNLGWWQSTPWFGLTTHFMARPYEKPTSVQ